MARAYVRARARRRPAPSRWPPAAKQAPTSISARGGGRSARIACQLGVGRRAVDRDECRLPKVFCEPHGRWERVVMIPSWRRHRSRLGSTSLPSRRGRPRVSLSAALQLAKVERDARIVEVGVIRRRDAGGLAQRLREIARRAPTEKQPGEADRRRTHQRRPGKRQPRALRALRALRLSDLPILSQLPEEVNSHPRPVDRTLASGSRHPRRAGGGGRSARSAGRLGIRCRAVDDDGVAGRGAGDQAGCERAHLLPGQLPYGVGVVW